MKITKYIFTLTLLLILSSCQENKTVKKLTISATLNGFNDNTNVKLIDGNTNKVIDSTKIIQNQFSFSKRIENAPKTLFIVIEQQVIELFIGNENIKIMGEKKNFPDKLTITGSKNQDMKILLEKKLNPLNTKRMEYLKKMFQLRNENNWNDNLQKKYWGEDGLITNIDKKTDSITKSFVFNHINTDFALNYLITDKPNFSKNEIKELVKKLNNKYKSSKYAKVLNLYINNTTLQEGNSFVDFKGKNQKGQIIKFSSLLNANFTLLEFSSPHCSWCKKSLPMIKNISKMDKVSIVTMWVNSGENDWKEYCKSNDIKWKTLWDSQGKYGNAYTRYNIYGTPTYFLINKKGIIIKIWKGYDVNIEKEVRDIIKNDV